MHPVPVLVGEADEERVAGEAGIVDEDVEVAHRRLGGWHQRVDCGAVGEIAGQRRGRDRRVRRRAHRAPRAAFRKRRRSRPAGEARGRWRRRSSRSRRSPGPSGRSVRTWSASSLLSCELRRQRRRCLPAYPTVNVSAPSAIRLARPDRTLPAPTSTKVSTPAPARNAIVSRQRTMPVTCSTSRRRIVSGSVDRAGRDIGDERHDRRVDGDAASASAITAAAGAISAQWKGALTGSSIARLAPRRLGDLDRPLDRRLVARDDDLPGPIVVGRRADLTLGRVGGDRGRRRRGRGRGAPPSRPRRPAPPPAWRGRGCAEAAPRRRRSRLPAAASAEYSPSEWPAT